MHVDDKPTAAILTAVGNRHRARQPITLDIAIVSWTRITDTLCSVALRTVAIIVPTAPTIPSASSEHKHAAE